TGYGDRLYAMWKGAGTDQGLYYSSFDGSQWAPQQLIPGNTGPDAPVNIGMGLQYQETTEWCWLAVAASVAHYYNRVTGITQCGLMTTIGHNINNGPVTVQCCPNREMLADHPSLSGVLSDPYTTAAEECLENVGIPQQCIKSGGITDALDVGGNNAGYQGPNVSLQRIAAEVDAGRPVCVDITWPDGSSHVVAIAGVLNDLVLVLDPGHGETVIAYEDFPAQYFGGAKLDGFT